MASALPKLLIFAAILLSAGCREKEKTAFHGEEHYAAVTRDYSRTKGEAEKILHDHLTSSDQDTAPPYVYFPFQIIYAYKGGYLFVVGDFKVSFSLAGYYVNGQGTVTWLDLGKNLSVSDYKGSREKSNIFKG